MTPYLAGTKNAECVPIRKTVDRTTQAPMCGWPPSVPSQKPEQGEAADADLGDLPEDQRIAFAEAIGEVAGEGAEDGPGSVEENRHQRDGRGLR